MIRTNGEKCDLVTVSVDGSHEERGKYKAVRYLLPQNNPTVDLTSTSNYYHKPVHEYDDE